MKSHPKRSSFVAWNLNYLYELTLTLNARNRNHKESGREQDSGRARNQDFVAPAPYHIPLRRSECQSERAPALGENAFWCCVLCLGLWNRDRGVQINRQNIQQSEQTLTTEGQIMLSCKGRMIRLFNSTILQGDCHFVQEFFNFERRTENNQSQFSDRETERFQR